MRIKTDLFIALITHQWGNNLIIEGAEEDRAWEVFEYCSNNWKDHPAYGKNPEAKELLERGDKGDTDAQRQFVEGYFDWYLEHADSGESLELSQREVEFNLPVSAQVKIG